MNAITNRYEFVLLFDVENGNPNGDPDAGNTPRIDPETGHGLVTDVCLKRKIRNYISLSRGNAIRYKIYIQEKAVLNKLHEAAYAEIQEPPVSKKLPKDTEKAKRLTQWMCDNFYDIRAFGAVMTTEINCGQVRGPVQMAFAKSVESIMPQEISITRMAVTNEKDLDKERTMGRKHIVPYGLYVAHGFVSTALAEKTGFSDDDLELLWDALMNMFEHDRSAARGLMSSRKLFVFKHDKKMGNAPAHKLFDLIDIQRAKASTGPARSFKDYEVHVDAVPDGVTLQEKL
ncbi:type I-C CRISPR-associated protein Cas7/Csd2 [Desulfofustis glycolicus]|uniref:CRISPR-associated protein, Csd2 family n=1 Tax=Desulfofustis glycolicus DSM 9705 TaxID=1121409 RepID=A0A1M5WRB4_9BACT|nr:type I-C CRISPR-associated protein Cas7/Csd2 [Desulfofustis glycolicus]MCB2218672.1 type I-C CRISPR-associated protein Cas7/Csd2 [Desulfobulbaceae bacterium]SHH89553.1 CRISPR-associated protein, Csd2 family [Desulfofustis glycolicus DSM 9705]